MKNIIQLSQQKRTFFCHQPNDEMLSFSDRNAFNTSIDSEANSTQIPSRLRVTNQIAQRLKVVAPVFPAVALVENSIAFNVCYECSEPLGNKGLVCSNCKEHFHFKCHVKPISMQKSQFIIRKITYVGNVHCVNQKQIRKFKKVL